MKTALPENAKIAKEAKECMQECVSEFISFITSEGMSREFSRLNHPNFFFLILSTSQLRKSANKRSARPSMAKTSYLP